MIRIIVAFVVGGAVAVAASWLAPSSRRRRRRLVLVHILQGGNDGGRSVKGFHLTPENVAELSSRISRYSERIAITYGSDPFSGTEIMVGSSPSEQQLQSVSGSLRAVIIPFAGVPPDTRSLLLADPSLSHIEAYSLHHNADSTAEMAIALLFAASKNILPADAMLRKNDWSARGLPNDGTPDGMPLMLLRGKSALVLGLGQVGNRVSSVLRALGVRVKATRASCKRAYTIDGVDVYPSASLHSLLPFANILVVCLPQTSDTENLIGAHELSLLPPGSVLINVGRGAVVCEDALFRALNGDARSGLASAGLDCWWKYPTDVANRTCTAPSSRDFGGLANVVMSPHRGGGVGMHEIEQARMEHLASLLLGLAEGRGDLPGKVDIQRGY